MSDLIAVALDGPGGAGKSTVAREVAKRRGFKYVDTGAMYRTIGLYVLRAGADPKDAEQVVPLLDGISIDTDYAADGTQVMLLNGENVNDKLRTPEMSMYASAVSAIPAVRSFLLELQRSMARHHSVIMDGRDIGTVILPDAQVKVFLTAAPEVRAKRRYKELKARGAEQPYQQVYSEMLERDKNDSERAAAPLKPAEDALTVDTSYMDFEQVVTTIMEIIDEKSRMSDERGI